MRYDNFIPPPQFVRIRSRGRLPHWEVDNAVYFITFRLRDSLPREVAQRMFLEYRQLLRKSDKERARLEEAFALRFDREFDQATAPAFFANTGSLSGMR